MTKKIEDGGYAFPWQVSIPAGSFNAIRNRTVPKGEVDNEIFPGMSLRDWFAGQALAGIVAGLCSNSDIGDRAYDRVNFSKAAKDAYTIADTMIARKGGEA